MQIVFKDFEICGVGNLFGGEQFGYIVGVGFDFYLCMIGEVVVMFCGDVVEGQIELCFELLVDVYIFEEYIESE